MHNFKFASNLIIDLYSVRHTSEIKHANVLSEYSDFPEMKNMKLLIFNAVMAIITSKKLDKYRKMIKEFQLLPSKTTIIRIGVIMQKSNIPIHASCLNGFM